MSIKLSAKERKEIIIDHLQGIPNKLYEVKELSNGTYRVTRVQPESESDEHEVESKPLRMEPSKPKRRSITNEDIMMKLTELYENQNRVPQKPPPEPSTPRPPIDSTVEEETIKSLSPQTAATRPLHAERSSAHQSPFGASPVPMKPTTGRRRLVLG